jgi:colanic acid/amylovoran biosynthesis glycosyltransferase
MRPNVAFFCNSSSLGSNLNPFFVLEIKQLSKHFEKVEVFCRQAVCGFKEFDGFHNVKFYPISKNKKYTALPLLPFLLLRKEVRQEMKNAILKRKFSLKYLMKLCSFVLLEFVIEKNANKNCSMFRENSRNWLLYAYWLDIDAYTVARIKDKNPKIAAISRAHSFEINPITNEYFDVFYKGYIHSSLDKIYFISKKMQDFYISAIMPFYKGLTAEKLVVSRLGTEKSNDLMNQKSKDDVLRILSCSRVIPVKRLELIVETLKLWKGSKIEWTHIGEGSEFNNIKKSANELNNAFVNVQFLGNFKNNMVHQYYKENPVDLFINVSSSEGIPVTFMEAMSYGVPVLATNVGGSSEIVNSETGILVDSNSSPKQLRDELSAFMKMDDESKITMRKSAYEKWEKDFNLHKNSDDFSNMCKGL